MPLKTPSNILSEKDIHVRFELWKDKIYFLTSNRWANDGSFYWPKPNRYAELSNSFRQEFAQQQQKILTLQEEREKIWPIWRKVCHWLQNKLDNLTENDPAKEEINALVLVFAKASLDWQIRVLGEFIIKNNSLPEIIELTAWHQELEEKWKKSKYNSNICFIKEETGGYLKFTFQVPDRDFNKLDNYFFFRNNTFYEVIGWTRINHQNAIIECERSIFWNDFGKNFNGGFAGVINNSPLLNAKNEQCACPPFVETTNRYEFEFAWQPTYSLWQLTNPMGQPKGFTIQGKDLNGATKDLGEAFITHDLKKIDSVQDLDKLNLSACIFYLLPERYNKEKWTETNYSDMTSFITAITGMSLRSQQPRTKSRIGGGVYKEYVKSKSEKWGKVGDEFIMPLGDIKRKITWQNPNPEKEYELLNDFLVKGIELDVGGRKETINLKDPEYKHLYDHIGVQFFFNDEVVGPYPLSQLDSLDNIEINITANPTGIIYHFTVGRTSFRFKENTKLIMEASRIAKAGLELGKAAIENVDTAGEVISWMPIPGAQFVGGLLKKFGSRTSNLSNVSDAATKIISDWDKTLESHTQDSRKGFDEREGERKSTILGGIVIPERGMPYVKDKGWSRVENKSKGNYSRNSEGSRDSQSHAIGRSNTSRAVDANSTSVSYSYQPAKAVSSTLGVIPPMIATPTLDNNYSLLDFLLHKKSPALKMRLNVNKPILEHYINNKKLLRKDGHELVNEENFYRIINKAGFYRITTHMMEKDTGNFFKEAFAQGRQLYDIDPKEIWQLKLGKIKMPAENTIISKLVGLETTFDEENNEIESTDDTADSDGYAFLNYISFLRAEGETDEQGRRRFGELVNSLPTTGAKSNNMNCEQHEKPMHECVRSSNYHPLYEFGGIKDTKNNLGHSIDLFTANKDLFKPISEWINVNTTYWKYTFKHHPEKIEWHKHTRENGLNTYQGSYAPEKFQNEADAEKQAKNLRSNSDYRNIQIHRMDDLYQLPRCECIPANEVSHDEYLRRGADKDWVTSYTFEYKEGIYKPAETIYYYKGKKISFEEFNNNDKAKKNAKIVNIPAVTIKPSESIYRYYATKPDKQTKLPTAWWISFEKRYKTEEQWNRDQYNSPVIITKEEYDKGQNDSGPHVQYGKTEPDTGQYYNIYNPPSWKFEYTFSTSSKRITLDKNKKYFAEIHTYKNGKGRVVKDSPDINDGTPWECWLEKRGNSFALRFNRVKIIGIQSGNVDDLGGGVNFVDERENIKEIKIDEISPAATAEGQERITSEENAEENLTLKELLERLGTLEQTPTEELTEEQERQRDEERNKIETEIKKRQEEVNKDNYQTDDEINQNQRNRNR